MTKEELANEIAYCGKCEEFYQSINEHALYEHYKEQRLKREKKYNERFGKLYRGYTVNSTGKKPNTPTGGSNAIKAVSAIKLKEKIAIAIRMVELDNVLHAHEYVGGSEKLADAIMEVLKDNRVI